MRAGKKGSRVVRVATYIVGFTLLGVAVVLFASSEARFLVRAAYEESRILLKRKSIEGLIADPTTSPTDRAQLELVLEARDFAARVLELDAGDTYTAYADVGRDTLLLVLSASPHDALVPYTWTYPIAGTVAYKGFFDPEAAQRAATRLEARGYDTYLRPAGAFSTLGWFNDPLLSTALSGDPVSLAATVIHEIAHNTLYVPGATAFNESFASFVGYRGAEALFESRRDSSNAAMAAGIWHDELKLSHFYAWLSDTLERLYGSAPDPEVLSRDKARIFAEARERLETSLGDSLEVYRGDLLARRPLNNASVVASRLYRTHLSRFESLWHANGRNLQRAVGTIVATVERERGRDPFEVLEAISSGRPH